MSDLRGSRRHVLNWRQSPRFAAELNALLEQTGVVVSHLTTVLPVSHSHPAEARLDTYGPRFLPDAIDWAAVRSWWLRHTARANTPNWDLAAVGHRRRRAALVLVEAKANIPELSDRGKPVSSDRSVRSLENDAQIRAAIDEACRGWKQLDPHVHMSSAAHYQLANRLAFVWRLASLGLDTVLVYLGFTGDTGIADAGEPFRDAHHWERVFWKHAKPVVPPTLFERELSFGAGTAWCLARSLPCASVSPPRVPRTRTVTR